MSLKTTIMVQILTRKNVDEVEEFSNIFLPNISLCGAGHSFINVLLIDFSQCHLSIFSLIKNLRHMVAVVTMDLAI